MMDTTENNASIPAQQTPQAVVSSPVQTTSSDSNVVQNDYGMPTVEQVLAEFEKSGVNIGSDGRVSISTWLDIGGVWYDETGGNYTFVQSDTVFTVHVVTAGNSFQASGLIAGDTIYFGDAVAKLEENDDRHMQLVLNAGGQIRLHKEHLPQQ